MLSGVLAQTHRVGGPVSFSNKTVRGVVRLAAWALRGPFTAGSCAVIHRGTEVLLVRPRGRGGNWSLPGGFWKCREQPREALARELREELGWSSDFGAEPLDQYRQVSANHIEFLYGIDGTDVCLRPARSLEISEISAVPAERASKIVARDR